MSCSKCKKDKPIKNAFHKLCLECNSKRLEAKKEPKSTIYINKKEKSSRIKEPRIKRKVESTASIKQKRGRKKMNKNFNLDELFYEECFNSCKDHSCEECGNKLPTEFRNDDGKVIARFRYSHIIAKSIAPDLRHIINNINHLCISCHTKWDFGDKKSMNIYNKNRERFPNRLK
tara:strand:+ start:959 stop:1480 length:522 start_codon:yes stop_codon:yes gene_type:complete